MEKLQEFIPFKGFYLLPIKILYSENKYDEQILRMNSFLSIFLQISDFTESFLFQCQMTSDKHTGNDFVYVNKAK